MRLASVRRSKFAVKPTAAFDLNADLDLIAFGAFEQPVLQDIGPRETRSNVVRVWQRGQRGRSIALSCWVEDTMFPALGGSVIGLSVTDGGHRMHPFEGPPVSILLTFEKCNE
jgi:hypothetical protein